MAAVVFKPDGLAGAAVMDLTSSPSPNLSALRQLLTGIKLSPTPRTTTHQAIKSLIYQLENAMEEGVILTTLSLFATLYIECGLVFQNEVSIGDLAIGFIHRNDITPEMRAMALAMIGDWGLNPESPQSVQYAFEKMVKEEYRFHVDTLRKISPERMKRIRSTSYPKTFLVMRLLKSPYCPPSQLEVPKYSTWSSDLPPLFTEFGLGEREALDQDILPMYSEPTYSEFSEE
ncbi:hypothetical protein BCR33DRAFT_717091 [Rhizoclosmatium globosum]|uniref:VHS domain-containing protein n=1 Tax=Rhizoclosmatium globosum TaxID=329046 RepID=A0A1Y2CAK9_9FUNG|nr:hypothetical protein BCR33DRAFT_717091 [Rhizoclosmatium globosum]|eukprot:ORY43966.1 hypothetical protein BCR33DRAFT_717091 [Rhizoclosmatium globosum]